VRDASAQTCPLQSNAASQAVPRAAAFDAAVQTSADAATEVSSAAAAAAAAAFEQGLYLALPQTDITERACDALKRLQTDLLDTRTAALALLSQLGALAAARAPAALLFHDAATPGSPCDSVDSCRATVSALASELAPPLLTPASGAAPGVDSLSPELLLTARAVTSLHERLGQLRADVDAWAPGEALGRGQSEQLLSDLDRERGSAAMLTRVRACLRCACFVRLARRCSADSPRFTHGGCCAGAAAGQAGERTAAAPPAGSRAGRAPGSGQLRAYPGVCLLLA